jgi:hypothetical protein
MTNSSRSRAQTWPYPRHQEFEREHRSAAAAWFAKRNLPVQNRSGYILETWEAWTQNIILPEVADYIVTERTRRQRARIGFPLHQYVHHGLSSQAMLFNLAGPLIVRHDLDPLKIALESISVPWPTGNVQAAFEHEDRKVFNEDSGQPTSIDLVIEDDLASPAIYLECKLVEREFGGCSVFGAGDCDGRNPAENLGRCYLHHIGRRYWTLLEAHGFLQGPLKSNTACMLAAYYQFFREALFAIDRKGYFVLLHDERSPTFVAGPTDHDRGLFPFLRSFVPEALKDRVRALTIQQVVTAVKRTKRHEDWIGEFESKYGLLVTS